MMVNKLLDKLHLLLHLCSRMRSLQPRGHEKKKVE